MLQLIAPGFAKQLRFWLACDEWDERKGNHLRRSLCAGCAKRVGVGAWCSNNVRNDVVPTKLREQHSISAGTDYPASRLKLPRSVRVHHRHAFPP